MDPSAALKAFAAVFPAELPDKTMIATVVLVTRYQRPFPVWCGAAAAFAVHVTVAVAAGGLLTLLPETAVKVATAALFAVGAVALWRSARSPEPLAPDADPAPHSATGGGLDAAGATPTGSSVAGPGDVRDDVGLTRPPPAGPEGVPVGGEVPGPASPGRGGAAASVAGAGLPSVRSAVVGSFGVIVLAEWGDLTQFATAGMAASTGEPVMVAIGALLALWAVAGLAASVGRQVAARLPIHLIQRGAAGVFALLSLSVLWSLRP